MPGQGGFIALGRLDGLSLSLGVALPRRAAGTKCAVHFTGSRHLEGGARFVLRNGAAQSGGVVLST